MIACAAYLVAQRYYPADMEGRGALTITVYFVAWLIALLHAGVRPYRRAWIEQLSVAALLCLSLPIASAIVGVGLPVTISDGDWIRAGLDLTAAATGLLLGICAWKVGRRPAGRQEAVQ